MHKIILILAIFLLIPNLGSAAETDPVTGMTDLGSILIPGEFADDAPLGPGAVDPTGTFAYVASSTGGSIFKIRIRDDAGDPTLRVEDAVTISGVTNYSVALVESSGEYAYFATDSSPAYVVRLTLETFTTTILTLDAGNEFVRSGIIDSGDEHLYLGTGKSPGRIIKIETNGFTVVSWLELQTGEQDLRAAAYDPVLNYAFFSMNVSPGRVIQINLTTFSRLPVVTFVQNHGPAHALTLLQTPTPGILAGTYAAPGRIVYLTVAPFTESITATVALPDPEFLIRSGVAHEASKNAYFLTDTNPVELIKIDNIGPTRVGSISLDAAVGVTPFAIMDPQGEYFFTSTGPNVFRRVSLTPEAAAAALAPPPPPEPEPEPFLEEPVSPLFPTGFVAGDLVKLPDDGNPGTFSDSSVYYLSRDGKRYVFPNDKVFFSWYEDFSRVIPITYAELADISFGGTIQYRPGVRMVKLQSSPTVYVVDQFDSLRVVPSEEVAATLYGADWNKMIDDIPDAFWVRYTVSASLLGAEGYNPAAMRDAASTIDYDKR